MKKIFSTKMTIKNPIITNHLVHGQHILPGLAYVDLVYQLAKDTLELEYSNYTLNKLTIFHPLQVTEIEPSELQVTFEKNSIGWEIKMEQTTEKKLLMTALLSEEEMEFHGNKIEPALLQKNASSCIDMKEIYQKAESFGLIHQGVMKALGMVYQMDSKCMASLRIHKDSWDESEDFIFHPALIDGAAMATGVLFTEKENGRGKLYVPIYYEAFYCTEPLRNSCYIQSEVSSVNIHQDIYTRDILFFNEAGEQIGLLKGITSKLVREDAGISGEDNKNQPLSAENKVEVGEAGQEIEKKLRTILSGYVKQNNLSLDLGFYEAGLQSSQLLLLVGEIEKAFCLKLTPVLLFENSNLRSLIDYLKNELEERNNENSMPERENGIKAAENYGGDIAVVGMSGRYPKSYNLPEFWENLREGRDCISEIPKSRWNWKEYYSDEKASPGHIYSKWGGFVKDYDCFDPLFFNISPREAERMDPQERLFLEHCWMALEDAGYTRESLKNQQKDNADAQVGVYAAVMFQEYPFFAVESSMQGEKIGLGGGISSIANRVSYFCDFHGPSMTIDTACSSSLTTIYLACQDLRGGRIDGAIAGGVNLAIHPNKYLLLSQGQFLSSKGHCESFGEGADGYIPGEGVGVLFLKRVEDARRDRDHIYGVIKGGAINHGGRASGYTVPNPKAQSMVISMAFQDAGIHPKTISYVEAHGTGTKLGDPIEVAGLDNAFTAEGSKDQEYCWLGSAKSNIGHCEAAAGVAGVIKVLLQMNHKQIAPSLHSERLNPNIDFKSTAFKVNHELRAWEKPIIDGVPYPRRAGVSSFGAGGSNAHIIIEEYERNHTEKESISLPVIIILSAKTEDQLKQRAVQLETVIREKKYADHLLEDLAYTLLVGREAMDVRLGFLAGSMEEVKEGLARYIEGGQTSEKFYQGTVRNHGEGIFLLTKDEQIQEVLIKWMHLKKYNNLLELWVNGYEIDWSRLYGDLHPRRISLPSYPFSRKRYWLPLKEEREKTDHKGLRPLLDKVDIKRTIALTEGIAFESLISIHSSMLWEDKERKEFPTGALAEMVREGIQELEGNQPVEIEEMEIRCPIDIKEETRLHLILEKSGEREYHFRIEKSGLEPVSYGKARAMENREEIYLEEPEHQPEEESTYIGRLKYIKKIWEKEGEVIGELEKEEETGEKEKPLMLETAMRLAASTGRKGEKGRITRIKGLQMRGELEGRIRFYGIRKEDGKGSRLAIVDTEGKVLLQAEEVQTEEEREEAGCYLPIWEETEEREEREEREKPGRILLVYAKEACGLEKKIKEEYEEKSEEGRFLEIRIGEETGEEGESRRVCGKGDKEGYEKCLKGQGIFDRVCFIGGKEREEGDWNQRKASESMEENEIQLFRLIKGVKEGHIREGADFYVVSVDTNGIGNEEKSPWGGGLSGLGYAAAQGEKSLRVRNIEISGEELKTEKGCERIRSQMEREEASPRGELVKYRKGKRYKQNFVRQDEEREDREGSVDVLKEDVLKEEGVYVIVGGSGSIGEIVSRHLIRKYRGKIVWIGRREEKEIREKRERFRKEEGVKPYYIRADVRKEEEIKRAVEETVRRYGRISGAIFAGMVFEIEDVISRTKEEEFRRIAEVKVKGSVNLYRALEKEKPDFLCYFSSIQAYSFTEAANSCGYAAGIQFADSYVRTIQEKAEFPVGIINWGYWKKPIMGTRLEQKLAALEDQEGIRGFEQFVSLLQKKERFHIICLKTSLQVKQQMGLEADTGVKDGKENPPLLEKIIRNGYQGQNRLLEDTVKESYSEELNQAIIDYLFAILKQKFQINHSSDDIKAFCLNHEIIKKYERWLKECFNILETEGYIKYESNQIHLLKSINSSEAKKNWLKKKEVYANSPVWKAYFNLIDQCLNVLPEILQGKIPATEIIFPQSSMELVEGIYKNNPVTDYFNLVLADILETYVAMKLKEEPYGKIRIAEIGAGTGGTSSVVLKRLQPYREHVEYCYTDISKSFLLYAQDHYGKDNENLIYKLWNIEEPLLDQGIQPGSYDIVLATNVIHATKNIRVSLQHAKEALKKKGILLLNEGVEKSIYTLLTFGLLDGWWRYEDESLRISGSPVLLAETWDRVLKEEGFGLVAFPARKAMRAGQQVIAAESDGIIARNKAEVKVQPIRNNEPVFQKPSNKKEALSEEKKREYIENAVRTQLAESLKIEKESIDRQISFSDYGLDSILGVSFVKQLNDKLNINMNSTVIFDYTTVEYLTKYILKTYQIIESNTEKKSELPSLHQPQLIKMENLFEAKAENQNTYRERFKDHYSDMEEMENKFLKDEISSETLVQQLFHRYGKGGGADEQQSFRNNN